MPSPSQELSSLFEEARKEGLFSHVSFACGFFADSSPKFVFEEPSKGSFFDLASLTKALVTGPLVLEDLFQKNLDLHLNLAEWLGLEAKSSGLCHRLLQLRVSDLLAHNSGLPSWHNFYVDEHGQKKKPTKEKRLLGLNRCADKPLPHQGVCYSDVGYLLLGYCLELVSKKPLGALLKSFSSSLGLGDQGGLFFPKRGEFKPSSYAPTSYCALRGRELKGEVHDENAAFLGGACGHAGLFGSALGLLAFLEKFSKSQGFELIQKYSDPKGPFPEGFVWRVSEPGGQRALGHLGFTGCAFWLFPEEGSYLIFLTNRVCSGRLSPPFQVLRQKVYHLGRELLDA